MNKIFLVLINRFIWSLEYSGFSFSFTLFSPENYFLCCSPNYLIGSLHIYTCTISTTILNLWNIQTRDFKSIWQRPVIIDELLMLLIVWKLEINLTCETIPNFSNFWIASSTSKSQLSLNFSLISSSQCRSRFYFI